VLRREASQLLLLRLLFDDLCNYWKFPFFLMSDNVSNKLRKGHDFESKIKDQLSKHINMNEYKQRKQGHRKQKTKE